MLERAAVARLALERKQGREIIAQAADKAAAEKTETAVIAAWIKWYAEAFDSVAGLPSSAATEALQRRIDAAKGTLPSGRQ